MGGVALTPMLATTARSAAELPADGRLWAYEVKWDGVRVLADVRDGRLRMFSRVGNEVTTAYPELAGVAGAGLAGAHPDLLLDGEVVVLRDGVPSFSALAERMHVRDPRRAAALAARHPATFVAFDLLREGGVDLTVRPWQERRAALERLTASGGVGGAGRVGGAGGAGWQLSPAYDDRDVLVEATREQGLEGVVAKRRASRYVPGGRTGDWVKLAHKTVRSCLVGGWRWETGGRDRIGALLLGIPSSAGTGPGDDRDGGPRILAFAGRAGSGLTAAMEQELRRVLSPLRVPDPPFDTDVPAVDAAGAVWVRPDVVVDVRYLARGDQGRLRQPVLRGIRADLRPGDVREDE